MGQLANRNQVDACLGNLTDRLQCDAAAGLKSNAGLSQRDSLAQLREWHVVEEYHVHSLQVQKLADLVNGIRLKFNTNLWPLGFHSGNRSLQ